MDIFFNRILWGDHFQRLETAIVILLVFSLMISINSSADMDLSVGSTFRSYPISGVLEAESGYGFLLWGVSRTALSGYVRPRVSAASSVSYNSLDGALEVFPLSFLGIRAGGEAIQNDRQYSAYDCALYRCTGRFYRTYVEGEISLGAGPVFAHGRWRRERWSERDGSHDHERFIDPTSGLSLGSEGQSETVAYALVGLKLDPSWSVMAAVRYAESNLGATTVSRMPLGLLRYHQADSGLSVTVGGGTFESSLKKDEVTVFTSVQWEILPSLKLH